MLLQEMTWQEIDALDRATIVVAQFGAIEQHGPHLPLETDALIGREMARRLDVACHGRLLVLPTQWLGLSTHHMAFAGSITASPETYLTMAAEILGSLAHAGFRKFLVLNSHGGNVSILDVVLTKCRSQYPTAHIVSTTYWNAAANEIRALRESDIGGMGHACELETSLVLATRPELVRMNLAQPGGQWPASEFFAKDMLHGGSSAVSRTFDELSATGTVGDPRTATAEKGERYFQAIVTRLVQLVEEIESGATNIFRPVAN